MPFQLSEVSTEALTGGGPALLVGEWGMSEVVEETLNRLAPAGLKNDGVRREEELATKLLRGEFIRFKDDEEKSTVLGMAHRATERGAELRSEEKGEIVEATSPEFEPLEEGSRSQMVDKMLKGAYELAGRREEDGVLQHLLRHTSRNESYYPENGSSLAAKVKSMLQTQTNRPPRKTRVTST